MLDIFSGLRLVVKRRSISIDNAIFRCHWFFTSTLLVSFSLIITARQYVGQPIECHSVDKISESLLNSFCWVQSTFTVPQACSQNQATNQFVTPTRYSNQEEFPYPCIDNTRGRDIKMYAYYQWVGIVLFIQGLLFHLPYYLWKVWENGLIRAITGGLRVAVLSDEERAKKKDIVVEYIHDHLGCHKRYALKYFLCEFICLVNLMGQLWATNRFFDGQFLRYGLDVMEYTTTSTNLNLISSNSNNHPATHVQQANQPNKTQSEIPNHHEVDPMTYIFPRMTKCTYYDFGSSGDVQKHDALCLLPLNIINEKIYIAIWFWFIILALLTLVVIFYRLSAIVSESVRCKGLISRCKLSYERDIRIICRHCDVGDWFLFYMVAENLDPLLMREIIQSIADKIRTHFEIKRDLGMLSDPILDDPAYELKGQLDRELAAYSAAQQHTRLAPCFRTQPPHPTTPSAPPESSQGSSSDTVIELCDEQPHPHSQIGLSEFGQRSRRASIIDSENSTNQGLVRKLKRRLCNRRLWSVDLGAGELRRQWFCSQTQQQMQYCPAFAPDPSSVVRFGEPTTELPLSSAQLQLHQYHQEPSHLCHRRRSSLGDIVRRRPNTTQLTRLDSSSSTSSGVSSNSESFVCAPESAALTAEGRSQRRRAMPSHQK